MVMRDRNLRSSENLAGACSMRSRRGGRKEGGCVGGGGVGGVQGQLTRGIDNLERRKEVIREKRREGTGERGGENTEMGRWVGG